MADILTAALTSTVIAGLVSGLITKFNNDRNLSLKYITEERAAWRKMIKEYTAKIYAGNYQDKKEMKELLAKIQLSLNPYQDNTDKEDLKIITCLEQIEENPYDIDLKKQLLGKISYLLKHDWERSKNEAKPWFDRKEKEPQRHRYPDN
jgi:3-hydroxyacyl-CoA dehydrogenase